MATQMEFLQNKIKSLEEAIKVRETGNDFSNWRLCSDEHLKGELAAAKDIVSRINNHEFNEDVTLLGAVYMPDNDFGITERYYNVNQLVELLRTFKANPEVVQFIADMMEF